MKFLPETTEFKRRHWCGPYALALISGQSYDTAYKRAIRSMNYNRPKNWYREDRIMGMFNRDLIKVAKTFKTPLTQIDIPYSKTFRVIMDYLKPGNVYVLNITEHYVVVDTRDWTACDNQTKSWKQVADFKHKKCKVQNAWIVKNPKIEGV